MFKAHIKMFKPHTKGMAPGARLRLAAACLAACVAGGIAAAQPATTPAGAPVPLPEALEAVAASVVALRESALKCTVGCATQRSLLDGYVASVLAALMRTRGLQAEIAEGAIAAPGQSWPESLPGCPLEELKLRSASVYVAVALSNLEGERQLLAAAYAVSDGHLLSELRMKFYLPAELEFLASARPEAWDPNDRKWLQVLEELFPPPQGQASPLKAAEADFLLDAGLWQQAARKYLAAAGREPDRGFLRAVMGLQLAGLGNEAASRLRTAARTRPDSGPLCALEAWLALRNRRFQEAAAALERGRLSDPVRAGFYRYARGLMALERYELDLAAQELSQAADLLPQKAFVQSEAAVLHMSRGALGEAIGYYRRAASCPEASADIWAHLAAALEASGDTDGAIGALRVALSKRTDSAPVARQLALLLKRQKRWTEALDTLRAAAQLNPCKPAILAAYGDAAAEMWQIAEATEAFQKAAAAERSFHYATVRLASMLALQRRYQSAQELLLGVLAQSPDYVPACIQLGRIRSELGDHRQALLLLSRAANSPDYLASARLAMARACMRAGSVAEAVRNAQIAVFSRQDAESYAALAEMYLAEGSLSSAEQAALTATQKDPASPAAWLALALVRRAQDRADDASAAAQKALDLYPYSVEALQLLGALRLAAGDAAGCAEFWKKALSYNQWNADLHQDLAEVLGRKLNDWTSAREHYSQYVELQKLRSEAAQAPRPTVPLP